MKGIFIDPDDPLTIYVSFNNPYEGPIPPGQKTLFKTTNGGLNWHSVNLPSEGSGRIVAKDQDGGLYLSFMSRVYRSYNDGATWEWLETSQWIVDPTDIAIDPVDSQILYLPRRSMGMLKSTDGGSNWVEIDQGILATGVIHLAAPAQANSPVIYTDSYISQDRGYSWEYFGKNGTGLSFFDEIVVRPQDPHSAWVVMDNGTVYTSTNDAESWTKIINLLPEGRGFRFGSVYALATTPTDADRIHTLRNGMGIFRSDNAGENWRFLYPSEVDYSYSFAVHPTQADTFYSGYTPKPFQDFGMVRKTIDGGDHWTTVLTVTQSEGVIAVAIDPNNPETIYAGSIGMSENGGG